MNYQIVVKQNIASLRLSEKNSLVNNLSIGPSINS